MAAGSIPMLNTPNTIYLKNSPSHGDVAAYAQIVRDVAGVSKAALVDHYADWEAAKPDQEALLRWLDDHSIHPGYFGHREMAKGDFSRAGHLRREQSHLPAGNAVKRPAVLAGCRSPRYALDTNLLHDQQGKSMTTRDVRIETTTILLLLLMGLTMNDRRAEAAGKPLNKGERIVFLGDSITQAGAGEGGYVTLVKEALARQYPDLGIEVIGAGISGNRVPDLEARLDRDVIQKKPTLVVIYIGINDVWHSQNGRGRPSPISNRGCGTSSSEFRRPGHGSSCVRPASSAKSTTVRTRLTRCSRSIRGSAALSPPTPIPACSICAGGSWGF